MAIQEKRSAQDSYATQERRGMPMISDLPSSFEDPEMPAVRTVCNPVELSKHMKSVLPKSWGEFRVSEVEVLQHHIGSRCTVRVALETNQGKLELIGKVYASDRLDVYRSMRTIDSSDFSGEDQFSIPKPIAFIPQLHLLLQEKVNGVSATEIFLAGNEALSQDAAEKCGNWLSRFQITAPQSGTVIRFTSERLERWLHRMLKNAPQLEEKARLLFRRLEAIAPLFMENPTCACHGSYCEKQILLTESSTFVLDWDNHCISDPCRDVARFVFSLERLALQLRGSLRALDSSIAAFKSAYADSSAFEVAPQLPFYKAAHCLKLGLFRRERSLRGVQLTEVLLDEGIRVIQEMS